MSLTLLMPQDQNRWSVSILSVSRWIHRSSLCRGRLGRSRTQRVQESYQLELLLHGQADRTATGQTSIVDLPLDSAFERCDTPVVHVGCCVRDVSQRRRLEGTQVTGLSRAREAAEFGDVLISQDKPSCRPDHSELGKHLPASRRDAIRLLAALLRRREAVSDGKGQTARRCKPPAILQSVCKLVSRVAGGQIR